MLDRSLARIVAASVHGVPYGLAALIATVAYIEPASASLGRRLVALTGDPAPGAGDDVTFHAFTTPLNHSIMSPRIDASGRVAFIAFIDGPGVGEGNQTGIWRETSPGALELVVRSGDPAPGTEAGIVFSGVPSEYLPFAPAFAAGIVQFQGELAGPGVEFANRFGLWRAPAGAPVELLARTGDPAPQLPGLAFSSFVGGVVAESGRSLIRAGLQGPGVTSQSDEAIWTDDSDAADLLVREGDQAPGMPTGVVIGRGVIGPNVVFPSSAMNEDGRVLLAANLLGTGVDSFNDEALFLENGATGKLEPVIREGDPAPGFAAGVTFGGGSVVTMIGNLQINAAGHLSFTCRLGGAMPTTTMAFSDRDGTLGPVMPLGESLPDAPVQFGANGFFGGPLLNDADRIAFTHSIPDDDNDPYTTQSGVWSDRSGGLEAVVLPGDELEHGGRTLVIASVSATGFNGAGAILLTASLDDPVLGHRSGLLLAPAAGAIAVVALTGDEVPVTGPEDMRTVIRVVMAGLSEAGVVGYRLDFADGSSGHFASEPVPACPADVDGDGSVGVDDLLAVILAWGSTDAAADVTGDGVVNADDLVDVILGWGACA